MHLPSRLALVLLLVGCDKDGQHTDTDTEVEAVDEDQDGYDSTVDCDDTDASVNPGADEICGDEIDNDCVGGDASCRLEGQQQLAGGLWRGSDGLDLGEQLATGDLNGDGITDVVGAALSNGDYAFAGSAYALYGPVEESLTLDDAVAYWLGEDAFDHLGAQIIIGDANADTYDDLILGTNSGDHYVYFGPVSASGPASTVTDAVLDRGFPTGPAKGDTVALIPDIDGDDVADLAAASSHTSTALAVVSLVHGPLGAGTTSLQDDADTQLTSDETGRDGFILTDAGDVDADGQADLFAGANGYLYSGEDTGSVAWLTYGPVAAGSASIGDVADARFIGGLDGAGHVLGAGDVDGDGADDLVLSQVDDDGYRGVVYLFTGEPTGDLALGSATAVMTGATAGEWAGDAMDAGDLDEDGKSDLVIGAAQNSLNGSGSGAIYVMYGPISGAIDLNEADAILVGVDNERSGSAVEVADIDDDGHQEIMVGAIWATEDYEHTGLVYFVHPF